MKSKKCYSEYAQLGGVLHTCFAFCENVFHHQHIHLCILKEEVVLVFKHESFTNLVSQLLRINSRTMYSL